MSFSIHYDKQPKKFLKKYDKHIVKTLSDNPVSQDAKTIVNAHGIFRIRIGDFRVLYRVNHQESKIVVVKMKRSI
jgi:mRNA interferase RelE/StbE